MHKTYYMLLYIGIFAVLINCQRVGRPLPHLYPHPPHGSYESNESNDFPVSGSDDNGVIVAVVVFVIICLFGSYLCADCFYAKRNATFANSNSEQIIQEVHETNETNVFQSGIWWSCYHQFGTWNGPDELSLSFDPQSMRVSGSGRDDVGAFTIDGTFLEETYRIHLTKCYQAGTGDRSHNLGHSVLIQLTYNAQKCQFEGKFTVRTSKYNGEREGEGVFTLKYGTQYRSSTYEQV